MIDHCQWRMPADVNPTRVSAGERLTIAASLRLPDGCAPTGFSFAVRRTNDSSIANDTHFELREVKDEVVELEIELRLHLTPASYQVEVYLFNEVTYEIFDSRVPLAHFTVVGEAAGLSCFGGPADLEVSVRAARPGGRIPVPT